MYLTAQAEIANLDAILTQQKATRQRRHQEVIDALREVSALTQPSIVGRLDRLVASGVVSAFSPYWIVNAIVMKGTRAAIEEIASRDDVDWVDENFRVTLTEPIDYVRGSSNALDENHGVPTGVRAIGAPRVWYELGFTGAGRLVGNLDTGVDGAHPALAARWRGNHAPVDHCWFDVVRTSDFPEDDSPSGGHGTHVMGTICGNSTSSNDSIGVAPGAEWIACNGIDQGSSNEFDNDILHAFQWFADPDSNSATLDDVPDVVHNSWGVDGRFSGYSDCYQVWNEVIVNCEAAGVVVTYSAGNEGPSSRTLRSPATVQIDSVTVFSVGAVDADADTIPPYEIASFSSRGPTDCPPFSPIKPEVCAPGVDVYSSFPDGLYTRLSGTSMAGPHVAGVVALMRQANPNAEVREIKSILMRTAHDYGDAGEDNTFGFGFIDAYQAVIEVSANRGIVTGLVSDANSGEPLSHATVQAGSRIRQTNAQGIYTLSVPGDSIWTLIFRAYGFLPETLDVEVAVAETVTVNTSLASLPQATVRGTVRAGANVPVAGAIVEFQSTPLPRLTTDSDGEFELAVPGDSSYTLTANYGGVVADTSFAAATGALIDLNLYLESQLSQPQGPDVRGYRAYDHLDSGLPPEYDWVEIAPSRGGSGSLLTLLDRDSSVFAALPFEVTYYGQVYDTMTINENGWIAAGVSHDHSFFNFQIPSASGPPAMMALFWDNLSWNQDLSELCYFHDTLNCRVVIEYLNFEFAGSPDLLLSCQLQIFDPAARPTPSGDAEIVMLYERIDLAQSATVGIENPSETNGVLCLFNGAHGGSTWEIRAGTAIHFTTRTEFYEMGSLSGMVTAHPVPPDWSHATVRAGCEFIAVQNGGAYNSDQVMTGARDVMFRLPGYEHAQATIQIGADSVSQWSFEVWRLDPPTELSGETAEDTLLLTWNAPADGPLDALLRFHVFRDGLQIGSTENTWWRDEIIGTLVRDYYVVAEYDGGMSDSSNHFLFDPSSATEGPQGIPREFAVSSVFPNPFNSTAELTIALPRDAIVSVEAYDVLGRKSASILAESQLSAGFHGVRWSASGLPTGIYFIRIVAGQDVRVKKTLLLK
ncbi:S8 family serine peptidase [bacterium]|nr:S8 family serine peptidase [bacterium]